MSLTRFLKIGNFISVLILSPFKVPEPAKNAETKPEMNSDAKPEVQEQNREIVPEVKPEINDPMTESKSENESGFISDKSENKKEISLPNTTLTGQIYGSIMENRNTEPKEENPDEKMDVDIAPKPIPEDITFIRVQFCETGVKREFFNLKKVTRPDGSGLKGFDKVRIGEKLIAQQPHDGKLAEGLVRFL